MLIRLDSSSDKPIYRQIAESVAESIEQGAVGPGERLPSARSLAGTLDVNMHTVLRAYSQLEEWGMVEMRRGRGGVVVSPESSLRNLVTTLVAQARRQKIDKRDVVEMLEEAWR